MARVVEVVVALHDGVVDVRVVHRQPRAIVRRDCGQRAAARERDGAVLDDLRLVLQQVPAAVAGGVLRVEAVVEDVARIQDQSGGKQTGHQRHRAASERPGNIQDVDDAALSRSPMGFRIVEVVGGSSVYDRHAFRLLSRWLKGSNFSSLFFSSLVSSMISFFNSFSSSTSSISSSSKK